MKQWWERRKWQRKEHRKMVRIGKHELEKAESPTNLGTNEEYRRTNVADESPEVERTKTSSLKAKE